MQVQGSRVLAFTAAVLGFVGLALSLAGGPVAAVGLAIAALALLSLLAVAWLALDAPRADAHTEPVPAANVDVEYAEPDMFPAQESETVEWEAPPFAPPAPQEAAPPPQTEPAIDLDSPLQRALAGLPPKPSAPNRYSPRMPVIPEEDEEEAEPVRRARRLVPSGQTLGEKRDAARKAKAAPEEMEFTVVPAKPRGPARSGVVPTPQVPMVVARVAGKGPTPPDLARGKCSGCGALLWAPKARPISLRCPQCDKITLLK